MSRRALIALVLLAALPLGVLVLVAEDEEAGGPAAVVKARTVPFRGGQLPRELERRAAPRFRLRDARGGVVDSDALRGRPYVLTFLFTDCRDVCPLIGSETPRRFAAESRPLRLEPSPFL